MDLVWETRRSAKRKKVAITIERDRAVVVHAPMEVSDEKLTQIVECRRPWIYEKLHYVQKDQPLPHPPGKELINGESALYLGPAYRIQLVDDSDAGIRFANRLYIPRARAAQHSSNRRRIIATKCLQTVPGPAEPSSTIPGGSADQRFTGSTGRKWL